MNSSLPVLAAALAASCLLPAARAGTTVEVKVYGSVEYNSINKVPLNAVAGGENAVLSFRVDSDDFVNGPMFPTRGYVIDQASCLLAFDSVTVGLQNPFPAGETPYFAIRNNDPAVDGFFISTNVENYGGLPIASTGIFGNFLDNFYVTYGGDLLPSLDILDAVGSYDFTGLTVFNWTVDDGPFNPMGLIFDHMTIEVVTPPQTWTDMGSALAGVAGDPLLAGTGDLVVDGENTLTLTQAAPNAVAGLVVGFSSLPAAFKGGTILPNFDLNPLFIVTTPGGEFVLPFRTPFGVPSGFELWLQYAIPDAAAIKGYALSNALLGLFP